MNTSDLDGDVDEYDAGNEILGDIAADDLADVRAHGGPVWDLAGFEADFDLIGYCEPLFVVVDRKLDGVTGTLEYVASRDGWPRRFFSFHPYAALILGGPKCLVHHVRIAVVTLSVSG